jgi:transposase InsO family protein
LYAGRIKREQEMIPEVQRARNANWQVDGARKVWKQMHREGIGVTRCAVERLTGELSPTGARRGRRIRTTTRYTG